DIYVPHFSAKCTNLDGAYFGTNFPHMFFMVFPQRRPPAPTGHFTASLYGFRIHPLAYEHQQMQAAAALRARSLHFVTSKTPSTIATNTDASASRCHNGA